MKKIGADKNPCTLTVPSFSGTFGIPTTHHTNQKCQKSLQTLPAPTHQNCPPKQKFSSPRSDNRLLMNNAQPITANISKLGVSSLRKVCTFNQNCNGLISWWHGNPSLLILANR